MKRSRFNRGGSSLIEVMIAMTIGSSLLTLTATWIHRSLTFGSSMRHHGEVIADRMRLSRQWCDDVWRSDSATIDDATLRLDGPVGEIRYVIDGQRVIRTTDQSDHVATDHYPLEADAELRWDDGSAESIALVGGTEMKPWRITSVVGRLSDVLFEDGQ